MRNAPGTRGQALRSAAAALAAGAVAVAVAAGCTLAPESRHAVLSFFFDGVPDPASEEAAARAREAEEAKKTTKAPRAAPELREAKGSIHRPYAENACKRCHPSQSARGSDVPFAMIDMSVAWKQCVSCHTDPAEVGAAALLQVRGDGAPMHGPVAAGECRTCHMHHLSDFRHLLRGERVEAACTKCHEHLGPRSGTMAALDCTACHDPHVTGTAATGYLRGGVQAACTRCHTLRKDERTWLHGPVAAGQCIECHDSHGRPGTADHVRRPLAGVCVSCHERGALATACDPAKDCDACHDPHSARTSAEMFLLARLGDSAGRRPTFEPAPSDSGRGAGFVPPPPAPVPAGQAVPSPTGR